MGDIEIKILTFSFSADYRGVLWEVAISLYLFVYYKALKIEILFIFFVIDNAIMTKIYYSSEIVLVDADL